MLGMQTQADDELLCMRVPCIITLSNLNPLHMCELQYAGVVLTATGLNVSHDGEIEDAAFGAPWGMEVVRLIRLVQQTASTEA